MDHGDHGHVFGSMKLVCCPFWGSLHIPSWTEVCVAVMPASDSRTPCTCAVGDFVRTKGPIKLLAHAWCREGIEGIECWVRLIWIIAVRLGAQGRFYRLVSAVHQTVTLGVAKVCPEHQFLGSKPGCGNQHERSTQQPIHSDSCHTTASLLASQTGPF